MTSTSPCIRLFGFLGLCLCPIDATGGFGGISTAEGAFVHQDHLAPALQHRIGCGDARQATTHYDRLRHLDERRASKLEDVGFLMVRDGAKRPKPKRLNG